MKKNYAQFIRIEGKGRENMILFYLKTNKDKNNASNFSYYFQLPPIL